MATDHVGDVGAGEAGGPRPGGRRVLIADDSPFILRMLEKMLTGAGLEVVKAKDGLEAIELAMASPDVRLIILDVMMPRMNGYQACRLLKTEPTTRDLPVVILTSRDQAGDRFWGLETGADHFITKDSEPQRILDLVTSILDTQERTGKVPQRTRASAPEPEASSVDVLSRINELLDRKLFEATVLSEIGRVARSLVSFDETVRSVMSLVARAVDFSLGALAFVDDDSVELAMLLTRPLHSSVVEEARGLMLERLVQHRDGVPFARINHKQYAAPEGSGPEEQALGGFLAVPVVTAGKVTGMLALGGKATGRASQETEAFLAQVSNQAMIVLDNARLFDRVRNLSIRDGLTGVFNRRHVMEVLAVEFERTQRYGGELGVIMVDIDHFKKINDQYHHQAGDHVIREVARLLGEGMRNVDAVGRYGGEEFIAVLPHTSDAGARLTAERVRKAVEAYQFKVGPDKQVTCTVSIGIACAPADGIRTAADLVREADKALYKAKESGRNRVV